MVWQVECSSTRAVDSVASFTTPMYPEKPSSDPSEPQGHRSDPTAHNALCLTFVRTLGDPHRLTNQLVVSASPATPKSSAATTAAPLLSTWRTKRTGEDRRGQERTERTGEDRRGQG